MTNRSLLMSSTDMDLGININWCLAHCRNGDVRLHYVWLSMVIYNRWVHLRGRHNRWDNCKVRVDFRFFRPILVLDLNMRVHNYWMRICCCRSHSNMR
jgi:hypothetical protein